MRTLRSFHLGGFPRFILPVIKLKDFSHGGTFPVTIIVSVEILYIHIPVLLDIFQKLLP